MCMYMYMYMYVYIYISAMLRLCFSESPDLCKVCIYVVCMCEYM